MTGSFPATTFAASESRSASMLRAPLKTLFDSRRRGSRTSTASQRRSPRSIDPDPRTRKVVGWGLQDAGDSPPSPFYSSHRRLSDERQELLVATNSTPRLDVASGS
jgi:hypothetical protein